MKRRYWLWLPAVIMMCVIFYFSSKPANESKESSMTIASRVLNIYENITRVSVGDDKREETINTIDHIIRKCAHFTEYLILAIAISIPLCIVHRMTGYRLALIAGLITALYAATDEFHQLYVPGRSGEIRDVLIDSSGALLGIVIFTLVSRIFHRKIDKGIEDTM